MNCYNIFKHQFLRIMSKPDWQALYDDCIFSKCHHHTSCWGLTVPKPRFKNVRCTIFVKPLRVYCDCLCETVKLCIFWSNLFILLNFIRYIENFIKLIKNLFLLNPNFVNTFIDIIEIIFIYVTGLINTFCNLIYII